LIASDWAVVQVWQAHQAESGVPFPTEVAQSNFGLIVRPRWKATVLPLTRSAYVALSALRQGTSFGAALDAALEVDAQFDLAACLQQWIAHGIFVAIALPTN